MKLIRNIRAKIKRVKLSQRTRHESIKTVLEDIVDLIEERCGEDISIDDIIKNIEGGEKDERKRKEDKMGS